MPNHVTTIIRASKNALDSLKSEESNADFNTIIPFPEELESLTAEFKVFLTQEEADAHQKKQEERNAKLPEFFRANYEGKTHAITVAKRAELIEKYGPLLDWYNWNIENWGTKWNAYNIERRDDETLKFETAWAMPEPVIVALSKKFPDVEINVQYADENWGHNYGAVTYKNGELIEGDHEHLGAGGDEAMEFVIGTIYDMTMDEFRKENPDYFEEEEDED